MGVRYVPFATMHNGVCMCARAGLLRRWPITERWYLAALVGPDPEEWQAFESSKQYTSYSSL